MKPSRLHCLPSIELLFFSLFLALSFGDDLSLVSTIKNSAFEVMDLRRTGVEYRVPLPANLTGVEASALKIRSRTFWLKGGNLSCFHFPPGILSVPNRRRLLLVSYNLGPNFSSSIYGRVTVGYSMASPVIGLVAYNGRNLSGGELGLEETGDFIKVLFPAADSRIARLCARFSDAGEFSLEGEKVNGSCLAKGPGRFSVVVDDKRVQLPAAGPPVTREERRWRLWVAVGAGSLVLACVVGILAAVLMRRKTEREMRKAAEEGVALEVVWVGGTRMPSAGSTRTHPVMD